MDDVPSDGADRARCKAAVELMPPPAAASLGRHRRIASETSVAASAAVDAERRSTKSLNAPVSHFLERGAASLSPRASRGGALHLGPARRSAELARAARCILACAR